MLPNPKISVVSCKDDGVTRDVIQSSLLLGTIPGGSMVVGFDQAFDDKNGLTPAEPNGYKVVLSFSMSKQDYENLALPEATDLSSTYKVIDFIADQYGTGHRRIEIRFNAALTDEEFAALVEAHKNEEMPAIIEDIKELAREN